MRLPGICSSEILGSTFDRNVARGMGSPLLIEVFQTAVGLTPIVFGLKEAPTIAWNEMYSSSTELPGLLIFRHIV